jgi:hypothetical protein
MTPHLTEKMGSSRKTEHFRRWLQFMRYAVLHNFSYMFTSAQRTTSSPTALPKSLLHHSGSQCTNNIMLNQPLSSNLSIPDP